MLHSHTSHSFLDGMGLPKEHAEAAREMGLPALAITDHGTTGGWYRCDTAYREAGVRPIFGIEGYFTPTMGLREKGAFTSHMLLLATSEVGLKNINRIATRAALEGFYYKPHFDFATLEAHSEGVIATSSCVSGPVAKYAAEDRARAYEWISRAQGIFGENLYLEYQPHDFEGQKNLNRFIETYAKKTGMPTIVTNDTHYPRERDRGPHQVSVCISTNSPVDKPAITYDGEFWIKSMETLHRELMLVGVSEEASAAAVERSLKIARMPDVTLPRGLALLPEFDDAPALCKRMVGEGFREKILADPKKARMADVYKARLNYEFRIVRYKGFLSYFLVIADLIRAAKDRGVMVGVARGSAGGSLFSYLMGITELDPIEWDCPFERFLPPHRGGYDMALGLPKETLAEAREFYLAEVV